MAEVVFHIEIEEDVLLDEWDEDENPPPNIAAQLEAECVQYMSKLFGKPVSTHGRRGSDGALICSFKSNDLARVRKIIRENVITEGNDQIASGAEYVIVRDFLFPD